MENIVPDISVLIEGVVSKRITEGTLQCKEVIIHEAIVAVLEHEAALNKSQGYLGLDELQRLRKLSSTKGFELHFSGLRPHSRMIEEEHQHEISSLIVTLAYESNATLLTANKVQTRVALAKGVSVERVQLEEEGKKLRLEGYFDATTMSVHLREGTAPYAKKGKPGEWAFTPLSKDLLSQEDIQEISREIIEAASIRRDGFIEIERTGSTIVQLGNYRIVITKPPFSDGWEITAVRPVKKLALEDYELSEKLLGRIQSQAEGILIAGSPGMGKSTFAQALADHYASQNKTVKTIEAPRDLVLGENVTQYAISHGDSQEVHDVLLLSRPDNTIFDEMRNTSDFLLFADLRLAGIGMAGVVHATNPIDAIQRFVGKLELGVIPQVIDTVIFIDAGAVSKVLSLAIVVKVPAGMFEADLARPVVVVNDFENGKAEFEMYTYGEQTVVVPVGNQNTSQKGVHKLAGDRIKQEFKQFSDLVAVEMLSDHKAIVRIPADLHAKVIGKGGETISGIEEKLGVSIDVKDLRKEDLSGDSIHFEPEVHKKHILIDVGSKHKHHDVDIYVGDDYLLSAKVGKTGVIKISKNNKIGKLLDEALATDGNVSVRAVKG